MKLAAARYQAYRARVVTVSLAVVTLGVSAGCTSTGTSGDAEQDARVNAERHLDAPYVVLVSFDGFRWDYQDKYPSPNFDRVAAAGVRAERMTPTFPSKTFPTHYSIATGMYAENHGLVGNRFWAPDKNDTYDMGDRAVVEDGSWYGGEPIWVTAERQDMVAASYFFVGSEAAVGDVRPTYWHRFDGSVPNAQRVDGVLGWLSLSAETRPHMISLYFSDVDGAGHGYGPDSPEVAAAVATVDGNLGRLLDGVDALPHGKDVYVILVSDHGMLWAPAAGADALDMTLFPGARMVTGGPYASIFVDEGGVDRAAAVRDSMAVLLPQNAVYLRQEVPERFHYSDSPRIGDIVIVAAPGRTIVAADRLPAQDSYTHGWDNQVIEMGAIFLAKGPRIGRGQSLGPFESVHVYPLIAEVLGLIPNPEADGRLSVLAPILGN